MSAKAQLFGILASMLVTAASPAGEPDWGSLPYTLHRDYQAVDSGGNGTFPLSSPIRLKGIILNRGADMLNTTPDLPFFFGGQWQVFVQAVEPSDFGGTAMYMAQRYGDLPFIPDDVVYSTQEWLDELHRLEHDPDTGRPMRPGDLVELRARGPGLFFGGKANVNEQHNNNPAVDFDVILLESDCGLPEPTVITLSEVKDATDQFIFDETSATGAEHFQGSLVRVNGVTIMDPGSWAPDAMLTVTDGSGRTLPLKLGLGAGISTYSAPASPVDIIAIFDQEAPGSGPFTIGYRLWLMDYDGNGAILPRVPTLPGDLNRDGAVDGGDIAPFLVAVLDRDQFETEYPEGDALAGNLDGNCGITTGDMQPLIELLLQP